VLTAWHLLHTAHHTAPGQTVLVHSAAGGVGNRRGANREGGGRARDWHSIQ